MRQDRTQQRHEGNLQTIRVRMLFACSISVTVRAPGGQLDTGERCVPRSL
jgi:hypothetical protein